MGFFDKHSSLIASVAGGAAATAAMNQAAYNNFKRKQAREESFREAERALYKKHESPQRFAAKQLEAGVRPKRIQQSLDAWACYARDNKLVSRSTYAPYLPCSSCEESLVGGDGSTAHSTAPRALPLPKGGHRAKQRPYASALPYASIMSSRPAGIDPADSDSADAEVTALASNSLDNLEEASPTAGTRSNHSVSLLVPDKSPPLAGFLRSDLYLDNVGYLATAAMVLGFSLFANKITKGYWIQKPGRDNTTYLNILKSYNQGEITRHQAFELLKMQCYLGKQDAESLLAG